MHALPLTPLEPPLRGECAVQRFTCTASLTIRAVANVRLPPPSIRRRERGRGARSSSSRCSRTFLREPSLSLRWAGVLASGWSNSKQRCKRGMFAQVGLPSSSRDGVCPGRSSKLVAFPFHSKRGRWALICRGCCRPASGQSLRSSCLHFALRSRTRHPLPSFACTGRVILAPDLSQARISSPDLVCLSLFLVCLERVVCCSFSETGWLERAAQAKQMLPPASYIWKGRHGTWAGHFKPYPRVSRSWGIAGHHEAALL